MMLFLASMLAVLMWLPGLLGGPVGLAHASPSASPALAPATTKAPDAAPPAWVKPVAQAPSATPSANSANLAASQDVPLSQVVRPSAPLQTQANPSSSPLFTLMGWLLVVLAAVVVFLKGLLPKWLPASQWPQSVGSNNPSAAPKVTVCQSLSLGAGKQVQVLQWGNRYLLVGSTPTQLSLLAKQKPTNLNHEAPAGLREDLLQQAAVEVLDDYPDDF